MRAERTRLIIGVALLAAAGGLILWRWPARRPAFADTAPFVCVATGEVFHLTLEERPAFPPGQNPKTGTATLLPAEVLADGRLVAKARYAPLLQDAELAKANRYVDPNTLELLESPR
ncbi:MAG: hypothetical protein AB1716_08410 [Planctomycetota bacterium]